MATPRTEYLRRWREQNAERVNAQARAYVDRHPDKRRDTLREWRRKYKDKRRAHRMVEYALAKGRMQRGPCDDCGDPNTQAHHHDYSKPLDVIWLCPACHGKRHRGL